MPSSASPDQAATPARAAWLDFAARPARSLRKLIGQGAGGPSSEDWASSTSNRKTRRPVWE
jgi:hypothetical protein